MSGFITAEGLVIPIGSDYYDYTGDIKRLSSSIRSVVSAVNDAAVTTIISNMTTDGRTPSDASPLIVYNQNRSGLQFVGTAGVAVPLTSVVPLGHMGRTGGFQTLSTSAQTVVMAAAQTLRGSMTFSSSANGLIIPVAGLYELRIKAYFSGSVTTTYVAQALKNNVNTGVEVRASVTSGVDSTAAASGTIACAVNDQITIGAYTVGSGSANVWGTDGFNGIYIEAEYKGQ